MTEFAFNVSEKVSEKLDFLVHGEISKACGIEVELDKLKHTVQNLKAVLIDAEEKQSNDQELRAWLQQLKDVFYDAEDVLDELEVEGLRRQVIDRWNLCMRKVRRFFSSSNPLVFRTTIARKVKTITERLNGVAADRAEFQLVERTEDRRPLHSDRDSAYSSVPFPEIIGRDQDKENIIELLLHGHDTENVSVLPVVGVGGIGKTSLATLVYNDERAAKHFPQKIWAYVSRDFDLKKLMEKIITSAAGDMGFDDESGQMQMEELKGHLRESIEDKKYLLVLDDVWIDDRAKWDELKECLMVGARGSMIMATTRRSRVASLIGTMPTYDLHGLSHDECLSLFVKYAFQNGKEVEHPNLLKIGDEIVKKCEGVTLAVRILAGQLFQNADERYWNLIKDSELWKIERKEDDNLPALRLSYEQLPSDLKRCFAYLSMFPKKYEFNDYELIHFWMAHGLLRSSARHLDLEDTGFDYLKELEYGCFLQDFRGQYGALQFEMHDVMHDLALSVAQDECLEVTASSQRIDKGVRHLSISDPGSIHQDFDTIAQSSDKVRSVFILSDKDVIISKSILETCMSRFKYLRALNLTRIQFKELPNGIGKLKHLRFLDLTWNHMIKRLPNSICKLQNLQTLLLGGCDEIEELPKGIRYMESLRFLWVATRQTFLPKGEIGCLKSLRFLWIATCENLEHLFEDIQNLSTLQSLHLVTCPSLVSLPAGIKDLTSLQDLNISGCEILSLEMDAEEGNEEVCKFKLQKLVLCFMAGLEELPEWLIEGSAGTLKQLKLEFCPALSELPDCLQNFSALQELRILGCPLLAGKCERDAGDDWYKIAHIRKVIIDNVDIKTTHV